GALGIAVEHDRALCGNSYFRVAQIHCRLFPGRPVRFALVRHAAVTLPDAVRCLSCEPLCSCVAPAPSVNPRRTWARELLPIIWRARQEETAPVLRKILQSSAHEHIKRSATNVIRATFTSK